MKIAIKELSNVQDPHTGLYTKTMDTVKVSRKCKKYMCKAIRIEKNYTLKK